jgi:hypothetical protein
LVTITGAIERGREGGLQLRLTPDAGPSGPDVR